MAQAAIPLPASTVVLIRPDRNHGFEIYLNRRPEQMDTYAGAYVFPGGRVEENDWSAEMISRTRGVTAVEAQAKLGSELQPEFCLGYWVAAVRELFEEVGIHYFVPQNDLEISQSRGELYDRITAKRPSLQRGEIDFAEFLLSERLCCDLGRLIYFFHRTTPEHYPVRFDTRFYLAALPPDQIPLDAAEEVSQSLWLTPELAINRWQAGNFPMMPPTLMVLRSLIAHRTWEELRDTYNLR
jgi:8-oxo-dGTP pyrophosphatase MutT (NUDIX family)